jgi:hypothetical protein
VLTKVISGGQKSLKEFPPREPTRKERLAGRILYLEKPTGVRNKYGDRQIRIVEDIYGPCGWVRCDQMWWSVSGYNYKYVGRRKKSS